MRISGFVTPIALSFTEGDNIYTAVNDPPCPFPVGGTLDRANAAAVHQHLITGSFCSLYVVKIILQTSCAGHILYQTASAVDVQLGLSHLLQKLGNCKGVYRSDTITKACLLWISVVGIPATIDNDIVCTDYTLGFDTATNTAVDAIDRLRDTMQSHERCSVVKVTGRNAGHLALYVGLAVGATAVLVPEIPIDFERDVIEKIRSARLRGRTHYMIVVAEGAGSAVAIGEKIHEELTLDPRVTILGHIQRGGTPSARDRTMATRMGYAAAEALVEGKTNRVICAQHGTMIDVDIEEGLRMKKGLNLQQTKVLNAMTGL